MPGAEKIQPSLLNKLENEQRLFSAKAEPQPGIMYRIIVSLKMPDTSESETGGYRNKVGLARIQQHVEALQDTVLRERERGTLHVLQRYQSFYGISAKADLEAIVNLSELREVTFVEEMPVMHKMDAESFPLTHTDRLHSAGYTGDGITIAIIDDGIDHDHAAFGGLAAWPNEKIVAGFDFADNDDDPRIDCVAQNHGTAVAGVALGNGGGVTGTAPDAQLVFLKLQSASQCGAPTLDGDLLAAIDWAVSHRSTYDIDIIQQ